MSATDPAPLPLFVQELGEGPPVLVLHGLLGQGRNWGAIGRRLARGRRVLLVDLRNHGRSPHHPVMTYAAMARDLEELIRSRGLVSPSVVGHSMGGKAAMTLALRRPGLLGRLVVVDVAPVDYGASELFAGYLWAMLAVDPGRLGRRAEAEAALAGAVADPRIRAFLASNLDLVDGRLGWLPNLGVLLGALATLGGFPSDLTPAAADLPVLAIAGGRSDYVAPAGIAELRRLFPAVRLVRVPEAGHWVHTDAPEAVLEALDGFLPDG